MKIIIFFLLITGTASAQTVKVATSTSASAVTVPTQTGMTAAIANAINNLPSCDTITDFMRSGGKLLIRWDKLNSLQSTVASLQTSVNSQGITTQAQIKAQAAAIATLQAQTTAQQLQLNTQQGLIDKLTAQVAALLAWQANMKIANQ